MPALPDTMRAGTLVGTAPNNFAAVNAGDRLSSMRSMSDILDSRMLLIGTALLPCMQQYRPAAGAWCLPTVRVTCPTSCAMQAVVWGRSCCCPLLPLTRPGGGEQSSSELADAALEQMVSVPLAACAAHHVEHAAVSAIASCVSCSTVQSKSLHAWTLG